MFGLLESMRAVLAWIRVEWSACEFGAGLICGLWWCMFGSVAMVVGLKTGRACRTLRDSWLLGSASHAGTGSDIGSPDHFLHAVS